MPVLSADHPATAVSASVIATVSHGYRTQIAVSRCIA
jgi:hypothetical protein